jgi:membrane-associated protease RseP (regulator of RpoE activity)
MTTTGPDQAAASWPPPDPAERAGGDATGAAGADGGAAVEVPRQRGGAIVLLGLLAMAGVLGGLPLVVTILAFVVMIFLHELGHYLAARWSGMKVTEFFLGFGPRIWSFRRGEVEYGIKAVPLGAYVKIIGMNNLDAVDPADEARTYRQAAFRHRFGVAVAGSAMHFAQALVLAVVLLTVVGMPDADRWQIRALTTVEGATMPAEAAGLAPGDRILAIDGIDVRDDFSRLTTEVRARPGATVTLRLLRDGGERDVPVTLAGRHPVTGETVGFLGVSSEPVMTTVGPVAAVGESFVLFGETTWMALRGLGTFVNPANLVDYVERVIGTEREPAATEPGTITEDDANRPLSIVGAGRVATQAADAGWGNLVAFLIGMNVFIGVFNLLPLLPLDGGHVVIAVYERLRSRKGVRYHADVRRWLPVAYGTVAFLGFVFFTSLYLDVSSPLPNPFGP